MFLVYFVLLKGFLIVFYHLDSLFNRKIVWKLTQVRIKNQLFFFSFKKKVLLKIMALRGRDKKMFAGGGRCYPQNDYE